MLVVLTILYMLCSSGSCNRLVIPDQDPQSQFKTCVGFILGKYFVDSKKLTIVDVDSSFRDDSLLEYVHSLNIISVAIRRIVPKNWRSNLSYMIVAGNVDEFRESINTIIRETDFNPSVRYLIVVRSLQDDIELQSIFNTLLQVHIYNVVVLNGTETAELYTYNPFENNACGKFYMGLTEFGKCSDAASVDLFPRKLTTGLRNCTFRVSCPQWAPYSIEPSKSNDDPYEMGIEQYIFDLMSKIEHFKYDFFYNYDPEAFSTVKQSKHGVIVTGPLTMLLANLTDVMVGGLVLTQSRARMFQYIHGHLNQVEDIRYAVKKASKSPAWKNFYIEFSSSVWSLTLLVFVFYAIILIILSRAQDKGHVVLVLLDCLLLHGPKIKARKTVNAVFIFWVWFAYLLNCCYQSSLTSLTTKPSLEYQIDDVKALNAHHLKPCMSKVMRKIIEIDKLDENMTKNDTKDELCDKFATSLTTVMESYDRYTAVPQTVYLYYKLNFYDKYGTPRIHVFSKPETKLIYAMYFYKGFPSLQRLQDLALRIREAGLGERNLKIHYALKQMKVQFRNRGFESYFSVPWYIYITGLCLSSLTLIIEIVSKLSSNK